MGKEKKEFHFIAINTVFETGALSEKGLLCVDDKAGCIQISVTEHASLLKTYQHGAHSGARGFLGKTAPFCLTQTPPPRTKAERCPCLHNDVSTSPRHKTANTLLEETIQRAISTPRAKSPTGQGLQVCISAGYGDC